MAKTCTFPDLYDEVKTLSITSLKKWGYLEPNRIQTGTVKWSRGERKTGSIGIAVYTVGTDWYINLQYTSNGKEIDYRINLVSMPSNLGIGKIWYFLCPRTGKQCRKLYLINTLFLHREAHKGCYSIQTYSKQMRGLFKALNEETAIEAIYDKHFKKFYAGKPTKRYRRVLDLCS